jgi:polar amino acid transport system substrate-binding protein
MIQKRNRLIFLAGLLATTSTLTAFSSTGAGASGSTLKAQLPKQYQKIIDVGLPNDTPPLIFQNSSGKNVGMDLDLLTAASKLLGVRLVPTSEPFANMLLGLEEGKFAFVTETTIDNARKKLFYQVSDFETSSSFGSLKSTATIGSSLTSVCGQAVGVVTGNNTVPAVTGTIDPACKKAGKSPVTMLQYPDFNTVYLNLKSGNIKYSFVDTGSYGYFLSQPAGSDFRFNGPKDLMPSPNGWSVVKANSGGHALAQVLQKVLDKLIANGQYAKILAKWGESAVKIPKAVINPPTSN